MLVDFCFISMEDQRHRVHQVDRQVEEKKKKVAEIEAVRSPLGYTYTHIYMSVSLYLSEFYGPQ